MDPNSRWYHNDSYDEFFDDVRYSWNRRALERFHRSGAVNLNHPALAHFGIDASHLLEGARYPFELIEVPEITKLGFLPANQHVIEHFVRFCRMKGIDCHVHFDCVYASSPADRHCVKWISLVYDYERWVKQRRHAITTADIRQLQQQRLMRAKAAHVRRFRTELYLSMIEKN